MASLLFLFASPGLPAIIFGKLCHSLLNPLSRWPTLSAHLWMNLAVLPLMSFTPPYQGMDEVALIRKVDDKTQPQSE